MADAKDPNKPADPSEGPSSGPKGSRKASENSGANRQGRTKPLTIDLPAKDVKDVSSKEDSKTEAPKAARKAAQASTDPGKAAETKNTEAASKPDSKTTAKAEPNAKAASQTGQKAGIRTGSVPKTAPSKPDEQPAATDKPSKGTSSTTSSPPATAGKAEPARAGLSLFSLIVAGLIGGGVAIGGSWVLQQQGLSSSENSESGLQQAPSIDMTDVLPRLEALESRISTRLENGSGSLSGAVSTALEAVTARVDSVESSLAALKASSERLDVLESNAKETETALAQLTDALASGAGGSDVALETLSGRLEALKVTQDALQSEVSALAGQGNAKDQLEAIEQQISNLSTALGDVRTLAQSGAEKTAALEQKLDQGLSEISAELKSVAETSSPEEIARLVRRMDGLAGLALIARLQDEVIRGQAYTDLMPVVRSYLSDEEAAGLEGSATDGVPTSPALLTQFDGVRDAVEQSLNRADPDASLMDRLLANAGTLVTIRSEGAKDDATPSARLARIAHHLADGDPVSAKEAWVGLEADMRASHAAFDEALTTSAEARILLQAARSRAISALSLSSAE